MKPKDITGQRFGRLVALRMNGRTGDRVAWECICDCGTVKTFNGANLRGGTTKSCGCYKRELSTARITTPKNTRKISIHGHTASGKASREYSVYTSMLQRCHNPNNPSFPDYGGRGVSVCERWRQSFVFFLEDMGPRPEGMQLDRMDNSKGYSKDNCRWTTPIVNSNNKRNNVVVSHNGESRTVAEWARILSVSEDTIRSRVNKGWPHERIVSPSRKYERKMVPIK